MRGRFDLSFIAGIGAKLKESFDSIGGLISNDVSQKTMLLESIRKAQDSTKQVTNIIKVIKKIIYK